MWYTDPAFHSKAGFWYHFDEGLQKEGFSKRVGIAFLFCLKASDSIAAVGFPGRCLQAAKAKGQKR